MPRTVMVRFMIEDKLLMQIIRLEIGCLFLILNLIFQGISTFNELLSCASIKYPQANGEEYVVSLLPNALYDGGGQCTRAESY